MTPDPHQNYLILTDQELEVLNNIIRTTKLDLTAEQTLMIRMGKQNHPVLDLTFKIAAAWEQRMAELQAQPPAPAPNSSPAEV
jgi:hypothetical protein